MNIRDKKILQTFPLHIWQANTGVWKAYIPDETRLNNRRVIQGKTKKNLEKKILDNYSNPVNTNLVFSHYFKSWFVFYKSKEVRPATIQRLCNDYNKYIKNSIIDTMAIDRIKRKRPSGHFLMTLSTLTH